MSNSRMVNVVNQTINEIAERYINFNSCFLIIFASILCGLLGAALIYFKIASFNGLVNNMGLQIIAFLSYFYVNFGFIKYSIIIGDRKARKIFIALIVISAINPILLGPLYMTDWATKKVHFTAMLSALLFFYVFRGLKNREKGYYNKLSKLNLFLFVFILLDLARDLFIVNVWAMLIVLIFFGIFNLLSAYWELKLFRHLHARYEQA